MATETARQPIVAVQGLVKTFKDFWMRTRARAVDGVSFHVEQGEIFGLLGPNGSGKSTTIKIVLGLLRPTSGRVAVFGKPPTDVGVKKRIGYLPEESYLYPFLNARETLDYYGKLFELDHKVRRRRTDELLDMVGLAGVQYRAVREYSKGMQRRIGLAQALINDPDLLILDEPTTGLDPIGTRQVKDLILALGRRGKTIVLSSHLLADVEDCVSRMVILYGGTIRAEGTCDELLTSRNASLIETDALDDGTVAEIDALLRRRGGLAVNRVSKPRQSLESLFIDIVERAVREKVATSGAQHTGDVAGFLKAAPVEGEALISELVEASRRPEAAAPVPAPAAPADRGPDADVLGSLLSNRDAAPAPSKAPVAGASPAVPPSVDKGVIDSLLGGPEEPGAKP
ncbi:MAG: ABC transporter ATP-binding protein [Phycisphaerae bacterium]|nr:ABC transporter ATP-binding protein [Phycisphaerae bacterium]